MTASPLVAVPPRLRSTASGNGTVAEMWEGMGQCGEFGAGGAEGIRTPDLLIANETLYQLSYDPVCPKPVKERQKGDVKASAVPDCGRHAERALILTDGGSLPGQHGFSRMSDAAQAGYTVFHKSIP